MEIPRHWRLRKQRYALVGEICPHCQAKMFPPREVCPSCGGETRQPYQMIGTPVELTSLSARVESSVPVR